MNRRNFLLSGLALPLVAPRSGLCASGRIDILPEEPIGKIAPTIYGHFTEHIGGVIYDGVWVGENSKVPNVGGIRKALVDKLRQIQAPVIRWPGGCFADSYDWRDGVGPRDKRPTRTNFWANTPYLGKGPNGPQKYEPNAFGTNEFAHFCSLAGAQPYIAADLRSLPARDFYQWIAYCNSPAGTTSLAKLRAQGGSSQPFDVHYWGVGNESWGCGGNFTGDEYAVEFRRYTTWVPRYGLDLHLVASGPNGNDYSWTESFFRKVTEKGPRELSNIFGLALHYYCGGPNNGLADKFSVDQWYSQLADAVVMEDLVRNHWRIMGQTDKKHEVKLVVDEWGSWHKTDPSIAPNYLFGYYPSLRDALVSGLTLDTFNRNADKIAMANDAQLINNINALFIGVEDRFIVTPNFYVFDMYKAHQGATSLRTVISGPILEQKSARGLAALAGSASMRGKRCTLTVTNSDAQNPQQVEIGIRGRHISGAKATVLTSKDIHAHNTLDQPNGIEPVRNQNVPIASPFTYSFAPASVTRLDLDLA
ncbi:MAG: alpha-N-arabinofuranosidase [Bryobacteraceae bacterium]